MIILITGDDIVNSRKKLLEYNSKNFSGYEITRVEKCETLADFEQATESNNMFNAQQILIFEGFFKGNLANWKKEIKLDNLRKSENIYVFWEESAGARVTKLFNKNEIFEFKIPILIWNFLDNIKPGQLSAINTFLQILKTTDENYLFSMIVRQFRLLILIKEKYKDYPTDFKRLTFQKYKLIAQANKFTQEQLISSYKKLLDIDEGVKTGQSIYDLKTEIEKFLINL